MLPPPPPNFRSRTAPANLHRNIGPANVRTVANLSVHVFAASISDVSQRPESTAASRYTCVCCSDWQLPATNRPTHRHALNTLTRTPRDNSTTPATQRSAGEWTIINTAGEFTSFSCDSSNFCSSLQRQRSHVASGGGLGGSPNF